MPVGDILEVQEIPFLDKDQLDGRFVAGITFYDGDWHAFLPIEDGRVVWTKAWPAETLYYGTHPETPSDLNTDFLQFIGQHANFVTVKRPFSAIVDDIHNIAASIYKLELLHATKHEGASRLAATEIEYLLTVCRSIFDHLQEALAELWKTVSFTDSTRKFELPPTFTGMVLRKNQQQTAQEIALRYGLPLYIAGGYVRHAEMFLKIREFRDRFIHNGKPVDIIFKGEAAFQVQRRLGPFRDLDIWDENEVEPNEIVPLLPILAQIIHGTFFACEDFARSWSYLIKHPPATAPDMKLYVRGYFNEHLIAVLNDAEHRRSRGRSIVAEATNIFGLDESVQPPPAAEGA